MFYAADVDFAFGVVEKEMRERERERERVIYFVVLFAYLCCYKWIIRQLLVLHIYVRQANKMQDYES